MDRKGGWGCWGGGGGEYYDPPYQTFVNNSYFLVTNSPLQHGKEYVCEFLCQNNYCLGILEGNNEGVKV